MSSGCIASMERPTRVSQDCSVLDVILPAAQDVPVLQQLLLTLFPWPLNALMFPTPYFGPSVTFPMTMLCAPVTLFYVKHVFSFCMFIFLYCICIEFLYVYFPVLLCLSVSVK